MTISIKWGQEELPNYTCAVSQKGRGCQAILSVDNLPAMPCFEIHLGQKIHTHVGRALGPVKCERYSNWPKENKDLEEVSYI